MRSTPPGLLKASPYSRASPPDAWMTPVKQFIVVVWKHTNCVKQCFASELYTNTDTGISAAFTSQDFAQACLEPYDKAQHRAQLCTNTLAVGTDCDRLSQTYQRKLQCSPVVSNACQNSVVFHELHARPSLTLPAPLGPSKQKSWLLSMANQESLMAQ